MFYYISFISGWNRLVFKRRGVPPDEQDNNPNANNNSDSVKTKRYYDVASIANVINLAT